MNSFINTVLGNSEVEGENPEVGEFKVEESTPETNPPVLENLEEDQPTEPESSESFSQESTEDSSVSEPTVIKKELDVNNWLEANRDTIYHYMVEKNTDYSALPKEEVMRRKIAKENPELTPEEITEELSDRYGLGLEQITIDEDSMDYDEIERAKEYNKEIISRIKKGQRELKKDASIVIREFEEYKSTLTVPKFEIEETTTAPVTQVTQEEFIEKLKQSDKEFRETQWVPTIEPVVDALEKVTEIVEYDDNGNKVVLNVDYKLSDEEKAEVKKFLADYIESPSDEQYRIDEKSYDLQRFVEDKTRQILVQKMLKTVAKEASALARKDFVKNNLLNFDDSPQQRGDFNSDTVDFSGEFFAKSSQKRKTLL